MQFKKCNLGKKSCGGIITVNWILEIKNNNLLANSLVPKGLKNNRRWLIEWSQNSWFGKEKSQQSQRGGC